MRALRLFVISAFLMAGVVLSGCGKSMANLDALAAAGRIDGAAPVQAHVQMQIAAPPERVWALLADAPHWPSWDPEIASVEAPGPLALDTPFVWSTGGLAIHSTVRLYDPTHALGWTGKAYAIKAVHVWQLEPSPAGGTIVLVQESMEGLLIGRLFPSAKLAEVDTAWLEALKKAAEDPK